MANALCVDIGNRAQKLVRIQLHEQVGNHLLHLEVLLHHSVGSIWDIVHNYVEVDLLGLVTVCVEGLAHLDTVGVVQHLEDLELSVLVPFVLEYLLDGYRLASLRNRRFEDHSERPIANDLLSIVREALLRQKQQIRRL